jgi:2-polyprenyl-3-methyl-5-hydroxy-6-metoxy-1,4-benzoquinol methylase
MKGLRNPLKTVVHLFKKIDDRFLLTEGAKARGRGERILIDDWNSAKNSGDFTLMAHIQRYEWILPLIKSMRVLDDGCGTGYGAYYLACNGGKYVTGIDLSKSAINYAKKHYKRQNLEYQVMNGCDLEFKENTFDAVISFDVLEHLNPREQEKFCSEAMRVLKPNGTFIVGLPNATVSLKGNPFHLKELTLDEFGRLLKEYFPTIHFCGQDIFIGNQRAKKDWHKFISNIKYQNLIIVDKELEEVFGLLAICKKESG